MTSKQIIFTILFLLAALRLTAGHVLIDGTLDQSDIYPGTVHTFQVYVPDQYDGKRPAGLYVGLDGVLCNAPQVMDSLIASRKIPCVIGVFLQPGIIKSGDGTVLRYNRSYEFDSTTGEFARFLDTELLPAVERMTTQRGKAIRLSRRPEDRMIFGLSSGGIAAFNAAWHRPDLFGQVFTTSTSRRFLPLWTNLVISTANGSSQSVATRFPLTKTLASSCTFPRSSRTAPPPSTSTSLR